MSNIVALGDAVTHGTAIIVQPTNSKIFYNGILLCLQGALAATHSLGSDVHPVPPIVNPAQSKVLYNGIPFAKYGAVIGCGGVVVGSNINPKVFIK